MIRVVAGLITKNHRILVAQRHDKRWEFPGGKIEPNESPQKALERELSEELNVATRIGDTISSAQNQQFEITLMRATTTHVPQCREHLNLAWMTHDEARSLQWMPLDIPLLHDALSYLNRFT